MDKLIFMNQLQNNSEVWESYSRIANCWNWLIDRHVGFIILFYLLCIFEKFPYYLQNSYFLEKINMAKY